MYSFFKFYPKFVLIQSATVDGTGLAGGLILYKKHVLKNLFVYIILSKTT